MKTYDLGKYYLKNFSDEEIERVAKEVQKDAEAQINMRDEQDFEKFKIICKSCGKEPKIITSDYHSCEACEGPGSIKFECECGEEEQVWL